MATGTPSRGGKHRPGAARQNDRPAAPPAPDPASHRDRGDRGGRDRAFRGNGDGWARAGDGSGTVVLPGAARKARKVRNAELRRARAEVGTRRDGGAPGRKRGFFRRFWWVFVAVPGVVVLGLVGTFVYVYVNLEIPNAPPGPQTTFVYDASGKVITTLHAEVNRTEISFDQIPDTLKNAVIAVEDKDFYHHGGISIFGIMRAAWANVTHRHIEQGGSTITQQYVKKTYTGSQRTFARKLKEAILAIKLEHRMSKNDILTKYLNTVYFGNGAYGAEAAAHTYFGIPARKLDVLQAATLAGTIAAPSGFDPVRHPETARQRRNTVLHDMVEQGYVSQAEYDRLKDQPVKVRTPKLESSSRYAYFMDYVRRELVARFGEDETFSGGLRVRTTLDGGWQRAAEQAVAAHLPGATDPTAALVAVDPRTGAVRALVGGRDFRTAKYNIAIQAHRQAGSAFKPFTLTAAFEQKVSPFSTWYGPPSLVVPDPRCFTSGRPWQVHNSADEAAGTMDLLSATAGSVNTIFAQLVLSVGPENVAEVAHRMGIRSDLQSVCSITLGTQGVTPLEMANAYATLAARGIRRDPTPFLRVKTASGQVLDRISSKGRQVIAQNDADLVTYALQRVVLYGTGRAAYIGRSAAGKTGTGQNYTDAWFCGYTPQLAACVWVGYPQGQIPMNDVEGFTHVYGGTIPALIWRDFMITAMQGQSAQSFPLPSFVGYYKTPKGIASPPPSPSPSPSPSVSPTPSATPTVSPTPSPTPTATSPSPTPTGTSPSPSPSSSAPSSAPVLGTLLPLGAVGLVGAAGLPLRRRARRRR